MALPRLEDAAVTYAGGARALAGVTLAIEPGVTAVVGPNGGGKSTLLALVAGRLLPTAGVVQRGDASIGYAAQHVELDPEMTADEHLALFFRLERVPREARRARRDALADALGLDALPRTPVRTYSGGMRRRLHLALALVAEPRLFVADEPEVGLDPGLAVAFHDLVRTHTARGGAVVMSSHDLPTVERAADRVVFVAEGRIVAEDATETLARTYGDLAHAYAALVPEREPGPRGARRAGGRRGRGA